MLKKYETPIQKLNNDINGNSIFVKREDLLPFSFGGNKARKAVFFFEEIIGGDYDYVVTYGSSSSNHCRVIANLAASYNIQCTIISPIEKNMSTFNRKMMELFGANILSCSVLGVKETIDSTLIELKRKGFNPYFIQGGGHGNLGTEAYVEVYDEIVEFEKKEKIHFDYIFHTSGTGTTQAGLICGQAIKKEERTIIGISNARRNPYGKQIVFESVNSYLSSKNIEKISLDEINFIDDFVIDGYGSYNQEIIETIKLVLLKEGISLDKTYTGKSFWGMKKFIEKNQITEKKILFIHTGGTPLFFDDMGVIISE